MMLSPEDGRIQVVEVEVPNGVHPVEYPNADDDYVVVAREPFDTHDETNEVLQPRGIDRDTFAAIWKAENPF